MPKKLSECQIAKNEYQELQTLLGQVKSGFEVALSLNNPQEAKKALLEAQALKYQFEQKREALKERINPFERLINLKEQYQEQVNILKKNEIIHELSTGEWGIKDILGREAPIPTYRETIQRMRKNPDFLKKAEQGLTKLLLTPFGAGLGTENKDDQGVCHYQGLLKALAEALRRHHREGKLFRSKANPKDPDIMVENFDPKQTLWLFGKYLNADIEEKLLYFPKKFKANHQGQTKKQILEADPSQAWQISLVEDLPNLPRTSAQAQTIGGRTQIDLAGDSIGKFKKRDQNHPNPHEYLKALQAHPQYQGESGLTPEDYIMLFLTHLEQTNQVIDDWQNHGRGTWLLGAYFAADGFVPFGYWDSDRGRARLDWDVPTARVGLVGVRAR